MESSETVTLTEEVQQLKTKEKKQEKLKEQPKKHPRFRVILWNDDDHSFQYVVKMMNRIFGYDRARGMIIACGVHTCGKTQVALLPLELAELKREQIRNFGPDPLIPGCVSSMYATLEEVEENGEN